MHFQRGGHDYAATELSNGDFQTAKPLHVNYPTPQSSDCGASPSERSGMTGNVDNTLSSSSPNHACKEDAEERIPEFLQAPSHQLQRVKPESARQRTVQACDKCRERKTKCSGHRPVCMRCNTRGLPCEYSIRETRARAPIRTRTYVHHSDTRHINYANHIRPTPAHHSRMGGGRTNAFIPSSQPYPLPQTRGIDELNQSENSICRWPMSRNLSTGSIPRRSISQISVTDNRPYNASSVPSSVVADIPFHYNYTGYTSQDGGEPYQPPYPPLLVNETESTTFHASFTALSLQRRQFNFEISSIPSVSPPPGPPQWLQNTSSASFRQGMHPAPDCCVNDSPFCFPTTWTSNDGASYLGQGRYPSTFFSDNNSSASTFSSTPISQVELACPTPSIPINPSAFVEKAYEFDGGFDHGFFDMSMSFSSSIPQVHQYEPQYATAVILGHELS